MPHQINQPSLAIVPASVEECASLAERFAKSNLLPVALRAKPADVLVTLLAGQELGLAPMASLRGIHVIEGKTVLSADTMVAVVLGRGAAVYFRRVGQATAASATYETLRRGDDQPRRCTWTSAMAVTAAINKKDNWRCYPHAMLAARAKAELARDVYPDVLAGCYTPDELGMAEDRTHTVEQHGLHADAIDIGAVNESVGSVDSQSDTSAIEPPWLELAPAPDRTTIDAIARIDAAGNVSALRAMAAELSGLPPIVRAEVRRRYAERMALLEANGGTAEVSA